MLKPSFYIESDIGPAEDFSECRLVLEINARSFSYLLLSLKTMYPVVLKYFQFDAGKDQPLAEILREIIYTDELLSGTTLETFIVYNFPESNLVPEKFFSADTNKQLTDIVYGNLNRGLILTEKIPWWELYNVYRVPTDIHNLLQKKFTSAKCWHYYSLQLKSYKMFNAREESEYIKTIFYPDKMVMLAFKTGRIQLAQSFDYKDPKDISYHLLNCCEQLQFNQERVYLQVSGMIEKKSPLFNELQKYFLRIAFEEIEENIRVTEGLQKFPLHYFSSLLKTAVCV